MKILLVLSIVVAVFGSAYSDVEEVHCPFQEGPVIDILILNAMKCLVPDDDGEGPNVDFLGRPDVTDRARELFRNFCGDLEPVKQCLNVADKVWKKCYIDDDEGKDFELFRDFLETSLDVFCAENGEKLVKVYQELQPNPERPEIHVGVLSFMEDCMRETNLDFLSGDERLHDRIFNAYRRMKSFRRCFKNNGKEVFLSTKEMSSLLGKVFHKMKCLHPVSKTFVLCSTLNHDGTGDRECEPRYANLDQKLVSQKLIDDGFQCFFSPTNMFGDEVTKEVAENATGEYAVNYCQNITEVKECLDEVTQTARLCLSHKTRHRVFESFQEMLEISLEIACNDDGVHLTRIFFGNYDRSGVSGEARDVVGECKDVSVTRIKHVPDVDVDDASMMSLRMYQEVTAFEECLVKDVKEETFKAASRDFINDVMNNIRCAHPNGGESVPCKSIVDGF